MRLAAGRILVAIGAVTLASPSSADEWSVEPVAQLWTEYSDNPLLLPSPEKNAIGAVADVSALFAWRSQIASLILKPDLRISQYRDYDLLDGSDQSLNLAYERNLEHGQISTSVSAIRDRTSVSELETTGIVEANKRRNNYRFALGGQWQPSDRVILGGNASYESTDFAANPFLVDYEYPSLSAYARRALDERTQLTLSASAGGVRGENVAEANDYGLRLGMHRAWSERWESGFSIGPSLIARTGAPARNGMTYQADLTHSGERSRWQFSALRELRATGRGLFEQREELSTSFSHSLTETWTGEFALRLIRSEEAYRSLPGVDQRRDYGRAEAALAWRWDPQWNLRMAYVHSRQQYASLTGHSEGNQLSVGVNWTGSRRTRTW